MFVLFASINPETLCADSTYGDFFDNATCIEAGPQDINLTYFF